MSNNTIMTTSLPAVVRYSRTTYAIVAWLLATCVMLQVLFVGMALFQDAELWDLHKIFVKYFAFLPILLTIISFIAKLPWGIRIGSLSLFLLIIFQFISPTLPAGVIAALHPVVAIILFVGAFTLGNRAWKIRS